MQLLMIVKTCGHFLTDKAPFKLLYLAFRNIRRRWNCAYTESPCRL